MAALMAARVWPKTATRVGYYAALWPSLVLWGASMVRDVELLLGVELALTGVLYLRERLAVIPLIATLGGVALVYKDRPYEIVFLGMGVLASFLFSAGRNALRASLLFAGFAFVIGFLLSRSGLGSFSEASDKASFFETLNSTRQGLAEGAGSAIPIDIVDTNSVGGVAVWAPIGLFYFWLAPIPFTGTSLLSLSTSPEMLALYFMVPNLWRSLRNAETFRLGSSRALFFYAIPASIGWSMAVTNVGTLYRHRTQVLFVLFVLIAADQVRRRDRALATHPSA